MVLSIQGAYFPQVLLLLVGTFHFANGMAITCNVIYQPEAKVRGTILCILSCEEHIDKVVL
jgi:hypothetical protein